MENEETLLDEFLRKAWEEEPELMAESKAWVDNILATEGVNGLLKYFINVEDLK